MSKFQVGDRVRLTGGGWREDGGLAPGSTHTVLSVEKDGWAILAGHWLVDTDSQGLFAGEVVVPEPRADWERELLEGTPFEKAVTRVLNEVQSVLVTKNRQYGDSALNPVRIFSKADATEQLKVRIDDKISRLQRGSGDPEDTVLDLIGYLVMLRIAENKKEEQ